MTCVEMEVATLLKFLNTDEKSLASFKDLSVAQGTVKFSDNEFNQVQSQKKLPQAVKFERMYFLDCLVTLVFFRNCILVEYVLSKIDTFIRNIILFRNGPPLVNDQNHAFHWAKTR